MKLVISYELDAGEQQAATELLSQLLKAMAVDTETPIRVDEATRIPYSPPTDSTNNDTLTIGRRLVQPGDRVKVLPSAPRKRDGFEGVFKRQETLSDGRTVVWVLGNKKGYAPTERAYPQERIQTMRQPPTE